MALVLRDRVKETTTTTGTGTITLAGASTGYQAFSTIGNANTTYYAIVGTTQWEVGLGTYTLAGNTLARTTILESSTGGTAVSFTAGVKDVFLTYPAELAVITTATQTLTNKTLTAPVIASIVNTGTLTLPTITDTLVGRATTDTLTNKTLTAPVIGSIVNTGTLTLPTSTDTLVGRATTDTLTNKTLTDPLIIGTITEDVFAITDGAAVDLNPGNGSIQTWTLGANRTATAASFGAGESMTVMVNDGTAFTLTWPTTTWVGGSAPLLATTGFTVVELWKVSTTLYGAIVGYTA